MIQSSLLLVLALLSIFIHASPPHRIEDPDYFAPSGVGGLPQSSTGDGSVVIITKKPAELRSNFFYTGSAEEYVVTGDAKSSPYEQEVQVKLWGAGGGGCDGGRVTKEKEELSDSDTSSGFAGKFVDSSFIFPVGQTLIVDVGQGGRSQGPLSSSLGGLGGYNGGKSGYRDRHSGGGGGGGISKISLSNGTLLIAAFGGNGGGNSSYCSALGGIGGRLRGMNSDNKGGYINSELALLVDDVKDVASNVDGSDLDLQEDIAPHISQNQWIPVTITQPTVATVSEANTSNATMCEHSNHRPTGRRGHSMTTVNNHLYIFGGATVKCICTVANDGEKYCSSKNVYSNEFWHFDVSSSTFTLLEPSGEMPRGREQHSATALPNGDMIIIGGLSSSDEAITEDLEPLNEVWKLSDPHRVTSHVISRNDPSIIAKLPMQLNQSHLSSHALNVDLGDDNICVEDLQLSLSLDHDCPQGIEYISLTGPPVPSEQDSVQSKHHQTKVFVSTAENRERDCYPSLFNLSFSDGTEEAVLSFSGLPNEGTYSPASSLTETFRGLAVNGEWKLSISTSKSLVEYNSSLLDWKLHIQAKSCTPRVKWEQLESVPPSFTPRHGHTAIAIESSIFILGGFAQRKLSDLWRFDYLSNTWTELNPAPLRNNPAIAGQAAVLGPWGLLNYGGLKQISGIQKQGRDLSVQNNLFKDEWLSIPLSKKDNSVGPSARYLSSIALIDSSDVIKKLYSIDGSFLLMFGGDGGHLINAYPNSYGFMPNTFFDDVWILSPSELNTNNNFINNRNDYCIARLDRDSTQYQIWSSTCGWEASLGEDGEPQDCDMGEILIMAWCKQQYQSFHMMY